MKLLEKSNPEEGQFYDVYVSKNSDAATIYFLGPYEGRRFYFKIFFWRMRRRGYRIVYLQPAKAILSTKQPQWLGQAIAQACAIIQTDIEQSGYAPIGLLGVSLGSYLGLNITLQIQFKKFVIVAGGVPLGTVFRTNRMFRTARRQVEQRAGGYSELDQHWQPYDQTFKEARLNHMSALFINSHNDRVITDENLALFLDSYKQTGVKIINFHKGWLIHPLQALSINFRIKQINTFFKD